MQRNVFGAIAQTIWCRTWKPDLLKEMRVLWVESYHSMACCICFCKPVWIIMNRENDLNCLSQGRDCLTACAHSNFRHASTYVIVRLQLHTITVHKDQVNGSRVNHGTSIQNCWVSTWKRSQLEWNLVDLDIWNTSRFAKDSMADPLSLVTMLHLQLCVHVTTPTMPWGSPF